MNLKEFKAIDTSASIEALQTQHISFTTRYYEKSIIEQAINQERSLSRNHWDETKRSIKEARYRLSLQSDFLETKNHKHKTNDIEKNEKNVKSQDNMTYQEKDELSMDIINP